MPSVRVKFAWYDLWIGAFIDTAKRTLLSVEQAEAAVLACEQRCTEIVETLRSDTPGRSSFERDAYAVAALRIESRFAREEGEDNRGLRRQ